MVHVPLCLHVLFCVLCIVSAGPGNCHLGYVPSGVQGYRCAAHGRLLCKGEGGRIPGAVGWLHHDALPPGFQVGWKGEGLKQKKGQNFFSAPCCCMPFTMMQFAKKKNKKKLTKTCNGRLQPPLQPPGAAWLCGGHRAHSRYTITPHRWMYTRCTKSAFGLGPCAHGAIHPCRR